MKAEIGAFGIALIVVQNAFCATKTPSLVEAQLSAVQDITGQPGAPSFCTPDQQICIDGSYRTTFTITRNIKGPKLSGSIARDQASARPRTGLLYLLVVTPSKTGSTIEWKGLYRDGLCLDKDYASEWGLTKELHEFPCQKR